VKPWFLAARPKTLIAGLIPVVVGSALAFSAGAFQWPIFACALIGALAIQIGTNFVNDASDFERGADTADRLGPARMAASGLITPRALYVGAAIAFLIAFLFGSYLIAQAGVWILVIGLFSIFFAVIYTAGPFPLAYFGLGDLFVMVFFGLVAVLGTVYAHSNAAFPGSQLFLSPAAILLALATGFHGMGLIAVNNLRDIPTDIKVGKKTLAVRLGDRASRYYVGVLEFLPYLCWLPLAINIGGWQSWLPYLSLPLAAANTAACLRITDRRQFNGLLGKCAGLQLVFGLLASIALVSSR
jgi:1,4-dihydroxy-2-naphthoate octaprenyltransferase